jgi:CRP-like cAMP-binding protein
MPSRAFVQVPGEAFRLRAEAFRNLVKRNLAFQALLMRYTLALVNQIAQSASCNRLHEVHERCARWLLQTHDRVTSDSFPLTQEFLGQMLGARRPTVSVAAGMLQKRGLIQYSRGVISILDRKGLERASCPCYGFITREYQRLMKF